MLYRPRKPKSCFSGKHKPPQIFDLLQVSRKENECRVVCLRSIRRFGQWKEASEKISDPALKKFLENEGEILRRQARDAIRFYRLVRKDRMKLFAGYMARLPEREKFFQKAC